MVAYSTARVETSPHNFHMNNVTYRHPQRVSRCLMQQSVIEILFRCDI